MQKSQQKKNNRSSFSKKKYVLNQETKKITTSFEDSPVSDFSKQRFFSYFYTKPQNVRKLSLNLKKKLVKILYSKYRSESPDKVEFFKIATGTGYEDLDIKQPKKNTCYKLATTKNFVTNYHNKTFDSILKQMYLKKLKKTL